MFGQNHLNVFKCDFTVPHVGCCFYSVATPCHLGSKAGTASSRGMRLPGVMDGAVSEADLFWLKASQGSRCIKMSYFHT